MTPLLVVRDPADLPPALAGPVVAIGNFDGVHRGHQALIARAKAMAEGRPVLVLTFAPHPRAYFRPEEPPFLLVSAEDKAGLLAREGVAGMIVLTFDEGLVGMPAEAFVDDLLVRRLGVAGVVVGEGFRFGRGRGGDTDLLAAKGAAHGFAVGVQPIVVVDGVRVSSTAIRAALGRGEVERAASLLGRPWFVRGPVVHGDKRGRTLGFPTANLRLDPACALAHGVYAVRAAIPGAEPGAGAVHGGVASFGRRPTFDDGAPLLETFLFDWGGDLYGRTIAVEFVAWLRGEARFPSAEALVARMQEDRREAESLLAARPPSPDSALP